MNLLFSADHHWLHKNILRLVDRPFVTLEEMNTAMIERWNAVVGEKDTVFYLGDFTLAGAKIAAEYFSLLNGQICLVPGSHDRRWIAEAQKRVLVIKSRSGYVLEILPPLLVIKPQIRGRGKAQPIALCHYPLRSWPYSNCGGWHLHGHSHGRGEPWGKSLDVGVDAWSFAPVSLEEISARLT